MTTIGRAVGAIILPALLGALLAALPGSIAPARAAAAPLQDPPGGNAEPDEPDEPAAPAEPAPELPAPLPAISAERGLARAESERKPLVVIVLPAAAAPGYRAALAKDLRASLRERLAEDSIVVEVIISSEGGWPEDEPARAAESPEPWSRKRARAFLEGRLGRLGDAPVLALLDFSGTLLARFDGEPPSEAKLKKALRGTAAANEKRAKSFAEAEKLLEQFGLALKRELYPEACRTYVALRALDLPLDAKPALARDERFKDLEIVYQSRLVAAKKLEDENQLAEAVAELDRILQDFPIPEWQDDNRRRIGILWRKIYGRGG